MVDEEGRTSPSTEKRTFGLSAEQAGYVDAKVASGAYATASEVVRAGLRALQERDAVVERWLREEAVPVAAAMDTDPNRAPPAEQVFAEVRALYAQRTKDGRGRLGWTTVPRAKRTTQPSRFGMSFVSKKTPAMAGTAGS